MKVIKMFPDIVQEQKHNIRELSALIKKYKLDKEFKEKIKTDQSNFKN